MYGICFAVTNANVKPNPNPNCEPNPYTSVTTLSQKPNDNPRSYSLPPEQMLDQLIHIMSNIVSMTT